MFAHARDFSKGRKYFLLQTRRTTFNMAPAYPERNSFINIFKHSKEHAIEAKLYCIRVRRI